MENNNAMFIRLKTVLYGVSCISRIALNTNYISFFVLDGAKTKQVDMFYENNETANAEFERFSKMLEERKELFVTNPKE